MKKLLLTLLVALVAMSVNALTYTVTVPEGTYSCYIAGQMNGWTQQEMAKVDATHFTIHLPDATEGMLYKYCSGPAWDYCEVNADGTESSNRNYSSSDVVLRWVSVYAPITEMTYRVTVPEGTNSCYIVGQMNNWVFQPMTKVDATNYSITLPSSPVYPYKYCSGPAFMYSEVSADSTQIPNRTYSPPDVVARWGTVYVPLTDMTYNVTVPVGTNACYLIGQMTLDAQETGWTNFLPMTKVDATHFTLTLPSSPTLVYKYCSGPSWDCVEKDALGNWTLKNRAYAANDVVASWNYVPVAADYYLPLAVGNYTKLHTTSVSDGYCDRSFKYSFIRTQDIKGVTYFVEEGWEGEYKTGECTTEEAFRYMWLRKDEAGNILLGAYATTENAKGELSDNLDSALVLPVEMSLFPNEFLNENYYQIFQTEPGVVNTDSVISVNATVGTYTNCLQIRSIERKNDTIQMVEDSYYAYHVGLVSQNRIVGSHLFSDYIVNYVAGTPTGIKELAANTNSLTVYPNPATDGFYVDATDKTATVSVYNLSGMLMLAKQVSGKSYINIATLKQGAYIVKVADQSGTVVKKLVKK